jgi:Spy/CpxP family protein refolding chaperone
MKHQTILFSFLSVLLLTAVVLAQPGRGQRSGQGPWMDRVLNLSEEQEAKIETLRLQHQKEMIPLRSKLESLQADLHLAMTAEKFDKSKTEKIVGEMQKVRTEMQMGRVMHQQAVRELLTPEQRQTFDLHLLSRKGQRGKGGFGPGPNCPDCPRRGWRWQNSDK